VRRRRINVHHHHIVIEGPLGVGKTSLALMLANKIKGQALLEDVEENPFLMKFYENPKRYGFQTQIFFLLKRYRLYNEIRQMDLFNRTIITDYLFEKDRIFARTNLDDNEYWLYDQLFQILQKRISPPDLVIFLQAKTEVLMKRIKKRNRPFERAVNLKYLEEINQGLNNFFFHYSEVPLLVIDASNIDFVNVPEDFNDLVHQIESIRSGTQYYIPASSR